MTEKTTLDEDSYQVLEKDFQEVMTELMADDTVERFRIEYEKIHQAFKQSHDSERRLMIKCRELNTEIVANSSKVSHVLQLAQDDQASIAQMKLELEKAWKLVDAATEREMRAKETIQGLRGEMDQLTKLVEQGTGLSSDETCSVKELIKTKERLTQEKNKLLSQIVSIRGELEAATIFQLQTSKERDVAEEKIFEMQQNVQMRRNEAIRETRKKDKLEKELESEKEEMEQSRSEIINLKALLQKVKHDNARLEHDMKELKELNEKAIRDIELTNHRLGKLQLEYQCQIDTTDALANDNQTICRELKTKEEYIARLKQENSRLTKMKIAVQKKLVVVENSKADVERQKDVLRVQISGYEREIEVSRRQTEGDRRVIEDLMREKDMINKNFLKSASATQKQIQLVKLHQQTKKNLEQEILSFKDEAQKQRKIIFQLEKERDRYITEASELTKKVLQNMEEAKLREMELYDRKRRIAESESKVKQQQNLYEAVRSERNLFSKNLIEAQDEISEMNKKLKIMNHQIDQLKDEISSKDGALVKMNLEHNRMEKEREALKEELMRLKQESIESKIQLEKMEKEVAKLLQVIREADFERRRQLKELNQVMSERDILGTQLVRRNDELALLYEKVKIQHSILGKGEVQYRRRLDDLRVLKLEVKKLRREKSILLKNLNTVDELRREVFHNQQQLLRERTRCKALEEELESPMNIHRWRKLEGADPSAFEMLRKVQALQKRLIQKTEEVMEKELLIQEKEKLYLELKHILARQPGPEVAEQLKLYQDTLRAKTKQMKTLASELNMYESEQTQYKFEIERLGQEARDMKKKYFVMKKKEYQTKNKQQTLAQAGRPLIPSRPPQGRRFIGGGYNVNSPQKAAA